MLKRWEHSQDKLVVYSMPKLVALEGPHTLTASIAERVSNIGGRLVKPNQFKRLGG